MAYQRRDKVLNCRVTENTLNMIDGLRYDCPWCSRADIIEYVFKILYNDIEESELKELIYYRAHYRYLVPDIALSIKKR